MPKCPRCSYTWKEKSEQFAEAAKRARGDYPNAFKPWSKEENSRLGELVAQGMTLLELAEALGRQPTAVQKRMELFGLKFVEKKVEEVTTDASKTYLEGYSENSPDSTLI